MKLSVILTQALKDFDDAAPLWCKARGFEEGWLSRAIADAAHLSIPGNSFSMKSSERTGWELGILTANLALHAYDRAMRVHVCDRTELWDGVFALQQAILSVEAEESALETE